ncbi:unnamed protein product [Effrenium voratum]|nr:unnamed protein product [Effrenium voratum]
MGLKCCAIDRVPLSSHAGIFLLVFTVDGPASSSHALQFDVAEALNRTTALYQTFACAVEHCRMTALLGQPLENLRADASIPFAAVVSNTCSALVASNEIDNSVSVWQTFCGKSNLATSSANATPTAGNTAYLRCGDALKVHWRDAKKLEDVTTLGCQNSKRSHRDLGGAPPLLLSILLLSGLQERIASTIPGPSEPCMRRQAAPFFSTGNRAGKQASQAAQPGSKQLLRLGSECSARLLADEIAFDDLGLAFSGRSEHGRPSVWTVLRACAATCIDVI